eukprot:842702_1
MPRLNENARAIPHSPPWIKSKVKIKNMTGLKSMCAIYGISTATFKYKCEYVSALMKYSRQKESEAAVGSEPVEAVDSTDPVFIASEQTGPPLSLLFTDEELSQMEAAMNENINSNHNQNSQASVSNEAVNGDGLPNAQNQADAEADLEEDGHGHDAQEPVEAEAEADLEEALNADAEIDRQIQQQQMDMEDALNDTECELNLNRGVDVNPNHLPVNPDGQHDDVDDEDVINELQHRQPNINAMDINNGMTDLQIWCANQRLGHLYQIFFDNGFHEIRFLALCSTADLKSMGLKLGEVIKVCALLKDQSAVSNGVRHSPQRSICGYEPSRARHSPVNHHRYSPINPPSMNIHVLRKKKKQAMQQMNSDEVVSEERINGRFRIKSMVKPTAQQFRLTRDRVYDIVLVQCTSTNIQHVHKMISDRTKNGDYSVVRYYFDTEQNDWPNTPVRMGWTAANRLKDIGLVNKKDKYKRNGRGGQEEWTGTIERLKLSEVWDRSSPSERQCIAEFIADKRGVDWRTFLIRTGDYLNAVQLGLVGPNECRYNVSLTQAINGSPSAQPSASGQLRINAHPSDGRGYLVEE